MRASNCRRLTLSWSLDRFAPNGGHGRVRVENEDTAPTPALLIEIFDLLDTDYFVITRETFQLKQLRLDNHLIDLNVDPTCE